MPVFETFDELFHAFLVAKHSSTLTPEERSEIICNLGRQVKRFHVPSVCEFFFDARIGSSYLAYATSRTLRGITHGQDDLMHAHDLQSHKLSHR